MKALIINKSDLTMKEIGRIMDRMINDGKEDTLYYGKKDSYILKHLDDEKDYKVEIVYLKSYVKWIFTEV